MTHDPTCTICKAIEHKNLLCGVTGGLLASLILAGNVTGGSTTADLLAPAGVNLETLHIKGTTTTTTVVEYERKVRHQTMRSKRFVPEPPRPVDVGSNRAIGQKEMLKHWGVDQWNCLDDLFGYLEGGWNQYADNPNSSAYGIPQALPGSKMASHGADWRTNPLTQIRWGLDYIKGRYSTPCNARSERLAKGWY